MSVSCSIKFIRQISFVTLNPVCAPNLPFLALENKRYAIQTTYVLQAWDYFFRFKGAISDSQDRAATKSMSDL